MWYHFMMRHGGTPGHQALPHNLREKGGEVLFNTEIQIWCATMSLCPFTVPHSIARESEVQSNNPAVEEEQHHEVLFSRAHRVTLQGGGEHYFFPRKCASALQPFGVMVSQLRAVAWWSSASTPPPIIGFTPLPHALLLLMLSGGQASHSESTATDT
jgi:hypothetical protein